MGGDGVLGSIEIVAGLGQLFDELVASLALTEAEQPGHPVDGERKAHERAPTATPEAQLEPAVLRRATERTGHEDPLLRQRGEHAVAAMRRQPR